VRAHRVPGGTFEITTMLEGSRPSRISASVALRAPSFTSWRTAWPSRSTSTHGAFEAASRTAPVGTTSARSRSATAMSIDTVMSERRNAGGFATANLASTVPRCASIPGARYSSTASKRWPGNASAAASARWRS